MLRSVVVLFGVAIVMVSAEGALAQGENYRTLQQAGPTPVGEEVVKPSESQAVGQQVEPQQTASPAALIQTARPLTEICTHTQLFNETTSGANDPFSQSPVRTQFAKPWQREGPLLVLDLETHFLYWTWRSSDSLVPIVYQGHAPRIATTDNLIVMICNARQGDGSTIDATSVVVNGPDANDGLFGFDSGTVRYQIDRMYLRCSQRER